MVQSIGFLALACRQGVCRGLENIYLDAIMGMLYIDATVTEYVALIRGKMSD